MIPAWRPNMNPISYTLMRAASIYAAIQIVESITGEPVDIDPVKFAVTRAFLRETIERPNILRLDED